jgi:hypothetical protein
LLRLVLRLVRLLVTTRLSAFEIQEGLKEGRRTAGRSGVLSLITMSAIAGAGVVAALGVVDCFMAC